MCFRACVCSIAWQQHDVQELCRVMFDALEQKWKQTEQVQHIAPPDMTLIHSQWEPSPQGQNKGSSVARKVPGLAVSESSVCVNTGRVWPHVGLVGSEVF